MKKITFIIIALIAASGVNAQLLWKISGNGLSKPSYLFGTHHVAPVSVIDSVAGLRDALAASDMLYGEIDMSKMSDPAFQMSMAQTMMAPADSTLSKVLDAAQLEAVDKAFAAIGLPLTVAQLDMMKPAAVSNILTMGMAQKANPTFNPNQQLDMTMQNLAREAGKKVGGLETAESQIAVLFGAPISEQAAELVKSVSDLEKSTNAMNLMTAAYLAGDIAELERLMTDPEMGLSEAEADRLLNNRNAAWVDFLIGALPTASIMIVVGAGHLPGNKGVINLLRRAGYDVTPVK